MQSAWYLDTFKLSQVTSMSSKPIYPRIEYFYLIQHKLSGKFYAGCRYSKNCHPSEFWESYFTSSKTIKAIIADEGKLAFDVLEIIPRPLNDALEYETNFLNSVDAKSQMNWFNLHNGDGKFKTIGNQTRDHIDKRTKSRIGYSHTDETKLKISIKATGRIRSPETNAKVSAKTKGVKKGPYEKSKCPWCELVASKRALVRHHYDKCEHFVIVDGVKMQLLYNTPLGPMTFACAAQMYSAHIVKSFHKNPKRIFTKRMFVISRHLPEESKNWVGKSFEEIGFSGVSHRSITE